MTIRTILLIDDEPDIRAIAELALGAVGGFRTLLAASGPEALARLDGERPDLVLLDVMMPGMDGLATFAAIRARPELADVPVVFMTAKVQRGEVDRYVALGAIGVIAKPFDPMTLSDEIRRIAGGER